MIRLAGSALTFSREPLAVALKHLSDLGFTSAEVAALEGWAHVSPARLAADEAGETDLVRRALHAAGLTAVAVNAGLGTAEIAEQCRRAAALARLAAAIGARVITIGAGRELTAAEVARLGALVDTVGSQGVALAVECHMGALTEDPAVAVAACEVVKGLRLTLDPSHYWAGPAQGRGWEVVAPFVAHVHLRDAGLGGWREIQVQPGDGAVDFEAVLACLRRAGYGGAFSEEYIDTLPVTGGASAGEAAAAMARLAQGWEA